LSSARVKLYIANGWDKKFRKDPDRKFFKQKQTEQISDQRIVLEKILDGEVPTSAGQQLWRISPLSTTQLWGIFSRGLLIQRILEDEKVRNITKTDTNQYFAWP